MHTYTSILVSTYTQLRISFLQQSKARHRNMLSRKYIHFANIKIIPEENKVMSWDQTIFFSSLRSFFKCTHEWNKKRKKILVPYISYLHISLHVHTTLLHCIIIVKSFKHEFYFLRIIYLDYILNILHVFFYPIVLISLEPYVQNKKL